MFGRKKIKALEEKFQISDLKEDYNESLENVEQNCCALFADHTWQSDVLLEPNRLA